MDVAPALVGKAGAELADGHELVLVGVVHACEQSASAELCPLALATVIAEQDHIDRVSELAAGIPFQLDPVEVARARLVRRIEPLADHSLQAPAYVVEQLSADDLRPIRLHKR